MPITTLDGYIGAVKQRVPLQKTVARTTGGAQWFSVFDLAGSPGAGVLAGASTTTGVVPTDATAGMPEIFAFGGGAVGYLSIVDFGSSVAGRIMLTDLLWKAGAYAFNASTTGQTPTSFLTRIPGGTAATTAGITEIWVEQVTAATGNQAVAVTYTNQAGVAGRTTGAVGVGAAPPVGRLWQLPLQAGDTGVSAITGVVGSVATVGTFNVLVLRSLWSGRCRIVNDGDVHSIDKTGMPVVYTDSALFLAVCPDSTSTGIPELTVEVVNG